MPEQLLQTSLTIVKLSVKSLDYDLGVMDWSVIVKKEG